MSNEIESHVRRFLDLEAVSDGSGSVNEEEMDDEDAHFIDDTPQVEAPQRPSPSHPSLPASILAASRESSASPPPLPPSIRTEDAEIIAQRYRDRAVAEREEERAQKRPRTGPVPYGSNEGEETLAHHVANTAETAFLEDSRFEMYMLKVPYNAEEEATIMAEWLPAACSVFVVKSLQGRIYFWVPDADAVIQAYHSRGRQYFNRSLLHFIPSGEVKTVFKCLQKEGESQEDTQNISVGSWVKIRRGFYGGDVGKVREILPEGVVELAVVPRISTTSTTPEAKMTRSQRPRQRLATLQWLKDTFLRERVKVAEDYYTFRRAQYRNGLRTLHCRADNVRLATPMPHEVNFFPLLEIVDLLQDDYFIRREDIVLIISGPLKNMVGVALENQKDTVLVGQLRRLASPTAEAISVRRTDAKELVDSQSEDDDEIGVVSFQLKEVRRLLDVGDSVLICCGSYVGKTGIIIEMAPYILTIYIDKDKPNERVPRSWIKTDDEGTSLDTQTKHDKTIRDGSIVMIQQGHWKNCFVIVHAVLGLGAEIILPDAQGTKVQIPTKFLVKMTPAMWKGHLPDENARNAYQRIAANPFVGMFVLIRSKDSTDHNTKFAKGKFGYVRSVDPEQKTARVAYLTTEAVFPLKNLVSFDYVLCLDVSSPLSEKEADKLSRRFNDYTEAICPPRATTPPPAEDARWVIPDEQLVLTPTSEPVTDFSGAGMWIFEPSVRQHYQTHKVFVHVPSVNRNGYITGELREYHGLCYNGHTKCQVEVQIDRSRTITPTMVSVAELRSCLPTKKNETVLQIRALRGQGAVFFKIKSIPKQYSGERPITVCDPMNEKRGWECPAWQFTKAERNN